MTKFSQANPKLFSKLVLLLGLSLLLGTILNPVAHAVDCGTCAKTGGHECPPPPPPEDPYSWSGD